ncbi:19975_t:CDS:2, partial [Funneliformis geosporum]
MSQNLFIDTHIELHELNTALQQLQGDILVIIPKDDNVAQSIFTNTQIEKFHKIWKKDPPLHHDGE